MSSTNGFIWQNVIKIKAEEILNVKIDLWADIINKLGATDEDKQRCADYYVSEVNKLANLMLVDMKKTYKNMDSLVEKLLSKINALCIDLSKEIPDFMQYEHLELYEKESIYRKTLEELQVEKESRMKEIVVLKEQLTKVCGSLQIEMFHIRESPLPSKKELEDYKMKIETLDQERTQRFSKFMDIRIQLKKMAEELGYIPLLDFEKSVLYGELDEFVLSTSNMKLIKEFRDLLTTEFERNRDQIGVFRTKLCNLYETLNGDMELFNKFVQEHKHCSFANLEAYEQEVKTWNSLKKTKTVVRCMNKLPASLVREAKEELTDLWIACGKIEAERNKQCIIDKYTEDFLLLLRREISEMKNYFEEHKNILALIKKYKELLGKQKQLDECADGPNRFKNRGGQLLKEEKERNALQKRIPQIEEELLTFSCNYETTHHKPFTYWGDSIDDMVANCKKAIEQEKKHKLSAKKQKKELAPKSSHTQASNVMLDDFKQKILAKSPNKQYAKTSRHVVDKRRRLEKIRAISQMLREKYENDVSVDLESDIMQKCRSSIGVENLKLAEYQTKNGKLKFTASSSLEFNF